MVVRAALGLCGVLALAGCVFGDFDDDGFGDDLPPFATDDGFDDNIADTFFDDSLPEDDAVDDETDDADADDDESDGRDPECGENVLVDGGFELGTPNPAWGESSPLFGTPICDGSCSDDPQAAPYAGDWYAWFGGAQRPDIASLSQPFAVEANEANLTFRLAINAASGTGDDVFTVLVDGNTVFMRTDADMEGLEDYTLIPVTLDQWADGQPHELRIESEVFGGGLTNFFVDQVSIVGCGGLPSGSTDDGASSSDSSTGPPLDDTGGSTDAGESSSTGDSGGSSSSGSGSSSSGGDSSSTSGGSGASSESGGSSSGAGETTGTSTGGSGSSTTTAG